jgi:hypothetical protein
MLPVCKNTEQKKKKARKQGAERVGAQLHCVLLWRAVPFSFIIWPRANPPIPPTDTHSLSPQNSPSPENSPDSLCCEVAAVSRLGETPLRFPLPPPARLLFSKSGGEPTRAGGAIGGAEELGRPIPGSIGSASRKIRPGTSSSCRILLCFG